MVKPIYSFSMDRSRKAGVHPYCSDCMALVHKRWREAYPERHAALQARAYDRRRR